MADVPAFTCSDVGALTLIESSDWSFIEVPLGPARVMPLSPTLIENCPFGLVKVPENGSPLVPFVPLQTYAVLP
jgi:hypothetical protein